MLWRSSRQFLTGHPAQLLLALAGIAAGVAVMTGVALLRGALLESLERVDAALVGGEGVRVVALAGPVPEDRFVELKRTPGAPELVPVLIGRVSVAGQALELTGIDPFLSRQLFGDGGVAGLPATLTAGPETVALSVATADRLNLEKDTRLEARIRGRNRELDWIGVEGLPAGMEDRLVADISTAQVLLDRPGELSHILAPAGSEAWLGDHLPDGLALVTADQRRADADRLTGGMRANLAALSGLALAVGMFVVFSVLSFLFVQRRRSFAVLRGVGVRPGQLSWLMVREALFLGAIGTLVGLGLGSWLAQGLMELVREPVGDLYQSLPARTLTPALWLFPVIGLFGLVACLLAVAPVAREAARVPAGRMLAPNPPVMAVGRRLMGAAILILAALLLLIYPGALWLALAGLFLLMAGYALLVPWLASGLLALAARASGAGLGMRGVAMLRSGQARIGPALSALTLAVAVTAGIGMMISSFRVSVDDWVTRLLQADAYLTIDEGQIDGEFARAVAGLPELEGVSSARRTTLADGRVLVAYDLPTRAWAGFDWLEAADDVQARFEEGRAVLVTEPFARRYGLALGDRVDLEALPDPDGLEIVGIFRDYSTDQGFIALAGPDYREAFDDPVRDNLGLYFEGREIPDNFVGRLAESVPGAGTARLTKPADIRSRTLAVFDQTFRITRALQILLGLIALVALVSSLLALALERARDYATLRALGLTRLRLAGLVTGQTLGLAAVSVILAIPAALVLHGLLTGVIQPRSFGWSLPMSWPLASLMVVVPWALAAGFLAGLYPAWKIARRDPAPWLKERL